MDIAIIVIYLGAMLAFGWWGKRKSRNASDYLVAGRRLGPLLYTSTMGAVVIGGASTVGGVGLGYRYGISGMWLVVAIAVGVLILSLIFAPRIQRLRVYTVAGMLKLRYGIDGTGSSGIVMAAYTLMLTVSSTIAYSTIFSVLFGFGQLMSVVLGGAIVVCYSTLGGMWAITLTDMVQFVVKTLGIFALMLPITWNKAGGYDGIVDRLGTQAFDLGAIGGATIVTYFVVYTFGILIGQDIWQRVFTARSPQVARWGGTAAGVNCLLYGVAGALIGTAGAALLPQIEAADDVYAVIAEIILPVGISGIVLAAAVAAMMSTASGALIATATVCRQDVAPFLRSLFKTAATPTTDPDTDPEADVRGNRLYVLATGILAIILAAVIRDVVAAITIAYDILVGGLLIPILGGLIWKRATGSAAVASMLVGATATVVTMVLVGDVLATAPVYVGLGTSLVTFIVVSILTTPTPEQVLREWTNRTTGTGENLDENETLSTTIIAKVTPTP